MEGEETGSLIDTRFRLFGIPIQTSFWFFPAMAGIGFIVSDFHIWKVPLFVTAMTLAVLAHEFGHALAGRWLGGRGPEIYLVFFGGLCAFRHANFTRWRELAMVFAGPLVNLLVAGVIYWALDSGVTSDFHRWVREFTGWFFAINLVLGIVNLVPVLPLDGGHILRLLLGRSRLHGASLVGILASIVMVLLGLQTSDWLMLVVFSFFGWYNLGNFLAWWRLRKNG